MTFAVEICEDLWAPVRRSGDHALAGAQVIFNLSASNDWVSKADYRRQLVAQQSGRLNAGLRLRLLRPDGIDQGHRLRRPCDRRRRTGDPRRKRAVRVRGGSMTVTDLDLDHLDHDRWRNMTFQTSPPSSRVRPSRWTPRRSSRAAIASSEPIRADAVSGP
jgi:NAD+ synthase (glutamine-hydrolysing)